MAQLAGCQLERFEVVLLDATEPKGKRLFSIEYPAIMW
jgi:hypothetical protein